jgi:tetratricopeptide (TPR) repeat protein
MKLKLFTWATLILLLGYFILITPQNPIIRAMRGEITDINANVIIGPYPAVSDFESLKKHGVGKIISLLDPTIPYEKMLLEKERVETKRLHLELANYPMISILGKKIGGNYEKNAAAAADDIAAYNGKVYVHCYLGIHRARVVKELLDAKKIQSAHYLLKEGERNESTIALDKAEQLYQQKYYQESKNVLDSMPSLTPSAKLLYAWALYRQANYIEARKHFDTLAKLSPDVQDVKVGLGYCDLQENKLDSAISTFLQVIQTQPNNESALTGLGLALYRQGKLNEAADYLGQVLRLNPSNFEAESTIKQIELAGQ